MTTIRQPAVCLITSRRQLAPDARTTQEAVAALDRWLDDAIGAVDLLQIREPDLSARLLWELVRSVAGRAAGSGTAILVNDRADVARAAGADGVHLPAAGPPCGRVRALGPARWLVGRSTHTIEEIRTGADADYLIFGTVFPSASKPAGAPVRGLDGLARAAAVATVPVLAVGGLDVERAARCRRAGAAGVAAIGLFLPPGRAPGALGIAAATAALRAALSG